MLYNQTIEVADLSLGDLRFQNVDTNVTMRLRTASTCSCTFEFSHVLDKDSRLFEEKTTGSGSSSFDSTHSCVVMTVGQGGDRVVRQSYQYVHYYPGTSNLVFLGGSLTSTSPQPAGVRARLGVFDDYTDKVVDNTCGNGFFFQLQNNSLQVVRRVSSAGEPQTDVVVDQLYFSEDTLDGNGPSGVLFDPCKVHTFFIDLSWVGTGIVRMGLVGSGGLVCVHTFTCSNFDFCKYASLPVRSEIASVYSSTQDSMHVFGGSVWSEGPTRRQPRVFTVGSTSANVESRKPVTSLRLKSTANRKTVFLRKVTVLSSGLSMWEVLRAGTLTGGTWSKSNSCVEVDVDATAYTGGDLVSCSYSGSDLPTTLDFRCDSLSTINSNMQGESTVITVCCTPIDTAVRVFVSVEWEEL